MSSVNANPTFNYSQPGEYNFSHDSVFLAHRVSEIIKEENTRIKNVLDLCSGCGVVGLDLLFYLNQNNTVMPAHIDFLEVQDLYRTHFIKNVETLKTHISKIPDYRFLNINYNELSLLPDFHNKYDLIICNPPYFRKGFGKLSPNEFKNRCRFFIDSDYPNLIKSIEYSLHSAGKAFVLLKSLQEHGINIEKEFHSVSPELKLKNLGLIRDTSLYCITKH
ncbi:methyltransferase [bacterium]|nr:methyltransferase [bacterium]